MVHPDARYAGSLEDATRRLTETLRKGDVLVSLGAGDVNTVLNRLMSEGNPGSRPDR